MAEGLGAKVCRLRLEEDRLSGRPARAPARKLEGAEAGVEVLTEDEWLALHR